MMQQVVVLQDPYPVDELGSGWFFYDIGIVVELEEIVHSFFDIAIVVRRYIQSFDDDLEQPFPRREVDVVIDTSSQKCVRQIFLKIAGKNDNDLLLLFLAGDLYTCIELFDLELLVLYLI